ncbi:MAG: pyrroline-5-carboxylate reductase [Anaerovoracaceae bacterium]|nr:pyrroline-5-carboxylate reductase [Anaerovoracaceae bacterium]
MKLGVIGAGNMGSAIIKGCITAGMSPEDIIVCGHHPDKLKEMAEQLGFSVSASAEALTAASDIVLIAVKPGNVAEVLYDIEPAFTEKKILVSIAAGRTIESLAASCATARRIVRAMPNTPALVGSGMTALSRSEFVTDEDYEKVEKIFAGIGLVQEVPESLMDAVTGLSGSGPAYVYMFIEALADGGVLNGLPRKQAVQLAAQTVLGSARMVLETGGHPAELKDAVCSPGGTTIEGVRELEAGGLRSTVIEAVTAATEKSKEL